jgi:plasmid stabilization system protein ParE
MAALPVLEEAERELDDAMAWYEARRPGYGTKLLEEVNARIRRARRFPGSGASRGGKKLARYDVRVFTLKSFPYSVIVAKIEGVRHVVAIAHHKRRPTYWHGRLR